MKGRSDGEPEKTLWRWSGVTAAAAIGAGLITASGVDVERVYVCDGVVAEASVQQEDLSNCDMTPDIKVKDYAVYTGIAVLATSFLSATSAAAAMDLRRRRSE
jgi:hypothetical protein